MRLTRKQDWPEILAAEIEGARERPFSFGGHDCCAFAARLVHAMTGVDFMLEFPAYADEEGAVAIVESAGGLEAIWRRCLGEPIVPAFAQRGDLLLFAAGNGMTAGILADHRIVGPGLRGVQFVSSSLATHAWRVG